MAVLDPDELLEQAESLVIPRRPGPPRQVDVRRAISAAYYAVFHPVCTGAATFVIGQRWQRTRRHAADYDPTPLLRTSDAQISVAQGRSALAAYRSAKPESHAALLTILLFKRR